MRCLHRPNKLISGLSLSPIHFRSCCPSLLPDCTTIAHNMSEPASMHPATHPSSLKVPATKMTHPTISKCVPASEGATRLSRRDYALRQRSVQWTLRWCQSICYRVGALGVTVVVVRAKMHTFPSSAHTVSMICIRCTSDILFEVCYSSSVGSG
jgi:hypothetical protein